MQNFICHCEGFGKCRLGIGDAEQILVRDNDKRINLLGQFVYAFVGRPHAPCALKIEGFGDHTDGQHAQFACGAGNNGCRTGAGTPSHAGCNKGHMRALQHVHDFSHRLLGGLTADFRI